MKSAKSAKSSSRCFRLKPIACKDVYRPHPPEKTRQSDLLAALSAEPVTERHLLDRVGDTRYIREILRKLIAMNVVERTGRGGVHDPFRYRVSRFIGAYDFSSAEDPVLERRMNKIEGSILKMLSQDPTVACSERCIRDAVGNNTGTGKALRRLVRSAKVPPLQLRGMNLTHRSFPDP